MNWLDLFIIVVIGLYCVIGWMRGFLHIAVDYASLGIGLLLAAVLHRPLGAAIAAQKGWSVGLKACVHPPLPCRASPPQGGRLAGAGLSTQYSQGKRTISPP